MADLKKEDTEQQALQLHDRQGELLMQAFGTKNLEPGIQRSRLPAMIKARSSRIVWLTSRYPNAPDQ